jgi:vanillate O-demethylase ferredoxin subunit
MQNWLEVEIFRRENVTDSIALFELRRPNGEALPAFTAGAHIDVKVSDGLVRQYSLSNDPIETSRYVIAVLNEPMSRGGSKAIHETFQQGMLILVGEPRNHFPLEDADDRFILVAGGIGVTPILAMARELLRLERSFEVHYCIRSRATGAFLDVFESPEFKNLVILHIDDEPNTPRLDVEKLVEADKARLYVCGPGGFMNWVLGTAEACMPHDRIHRESFAAAPIEAPTDEGFEVEIASTGQRFFIPTDKSVAAVLEEAGIEVLVSCQQGICGSCITNILEGEPDHKDSVLSESERKSGKLFTPCCSRAKSAKLVLDI